MTKSKRINPNKPKAMTAREKHMARQLAEQNGGKMPIRHKQIKLSAKDAWKDNDDE
jgi:hypothetical protein